jgi:hypothetical protein
MVAAFELLGKPEVEAQELAKAILIPRVIAADRREPNRAFRWR